MAYAAWDLRELGGVRCWWTPSTTAPLPTSAALRSFSTETPPPPPPPPRPHLLSAPPTSPSSSIVRASGLTVSSAISISLFAPPLTAPPLLTLLFSRYYHHLVFPPLTIPSPSSPVDHRLQNVYFIFNLFAFRFLTADLIWHLYTWVLGPRC